MRFEDQDGDAERWGYERRRKNILESASVDERVCRSVATTMFDELKKMIFAFEIGEPVDAAQFALKAEQVAINVKGALELRYAAQAVARELVGV